MARFDSASTLASISPGVVPDWRWNLARYLAEKPLRISRDVDDITIRAVRFCRGATDSTFAEAFAIFQEDGPLRWIVEANLLTGLPTEAVARKLGIDPTVVHIFERAFYDVHDRLDAVGWIVLKAFGTGWKIGLGATDQGSLWRWLAFTGGPIVLDIVYAVSTGTGLERYSPEAVRGAKRMLAALDQIRRQTPSQLLRSYLRRRTAERRKRSGVPVVPVQRKCAKPPGQGDRPVGNGTEHPATAMTRAAA